MTETGPFSRGFRAEETPRVDGYDVRDVLGAGGHSTVYLATDADGQEVALKHWRDADWSEAVRERIAREVEALQAVDHPHLVRFLGLVEDEHGHPCLVMQRVAGRSLAEDLEANGPLAPERLVALALPLLDAVEHLAARGLVHRDIKPGNVVLGEAGPVLVDLSIVRPTQPDATQLTATGVGLGTSAYMAPEQCEGDLGQVDARTDVYGLGALLFHAATGVPPWRTESGWERTQRNPWRAPYPANAELRARVRQAQAGVPRPLGRAIARCLEGDPAKRFSSAGALRAALTQGSGVAMAAVTAFAAVALLSLGFLNHAGVLAPNEGQNPTAEDPMNTPQAIATVATIVALASPTAAQDSSPDAPEPKLGLHERLGLQPGDKVISINGQPVGDDGESTFEQLKNETRYAILIERDGRRMVVTTNPSAQPEVTDVRIGVAWRAPASEGEDGQVVLSLQGEPVKVPRALMDQYGEDLLWGFFRQKLLSLQEAYRGDGQLPVVVDASADVPQPVVERVLAVLGRLELRDVTLAVPQPESTHTPLLGLDQVGLENGVPEGTRRICDTRMEQVPAGFSPDYLASWGNHGPMPDAASFAPLAVGLKGFRFQRIVANQSEVQVLGLVYATPEAAALAERAARDIQVGEIVPTWAVRGDSALVIVSEKRQALPVPHVRTVQSAIQEVLSRRAEVRTTRLDSLERTVVAALRTGRLEIFETVIGDREGPLPAAEHRAVLRSLEAARAQLREVGPLDTLEFAESRSVERRWSLEELARGGGELSSKGWAGVYLYLRCEGRLRVAVELTRVRRVNSRWVLSGPLGEELGDPFALGSQHR